MVGAMFCLRRECVSVTSMPSRFHEGARQSKLPDRKAARRRRGLDGRQRHRDRDCGSTPLALISLVCCPYLGFGLVRQEKRQSSGAAAYEYGSEAFARRRLNNEEQSGYWNGLPLEATCGLNGESPWCGANTTTTVPVLTRL